MIQVLLAILILLGAVLGAFILFVLFTAVCSLLVDPKKEYEEESTLYRTLLYVWTGFLVRVTGIRVHVAGAEKMPEGAVLGICNHRSNWDPIITWFAFPERNFIFISKESNFHIPLFGRIIHRCRFMAIDREDPRKAMTTIRRAADLISGEGANIFVYPEGTRSKSCELLPFHCGVLKIAQKASSPVAVMTIRGVEQFTKQFPLHHTDVYLDVLEVIPAETVRAQRSTDLGEYARDRMAPFVDEKKKG